jgi:hypothetical protein
VKVKASYELLTDDGLKNIFNKLLDEVISYRDAWEAVEREKTARGTHSFKNLELKFRIRFGNVTLLYYSR